ncbi:unnamed protein product, partial [Prunus brigantina]
KTVLELCKICHLSRGAIIWMRVYLLKYSDANFFVRKQFIRLSSKVVYGPLYANGKQKVSYKKTLYATVECTRDLSNANCKNCLNFAINEFLSRNYKMRVNMLFMGVVTLDLNFTNF